MGAVGNISPNDQYKWLYPKQEAKGQNTVEKPAMVYQPANEQQVQQPVISDPEYKLGGDFGWNVGVSGVDPLGGVYGVGRVTPKEFTVQGIGGEQISYANSKGQVGLTEMEPGAGSHYDPLLGHANHKKWLVA